MMDIFGPLYTHHRLLSLHGRSRGHCVKAQEASAHKRHAEQRGKAYYRKLCWAQGVRYHAPGRWQESIDHVGGVIDAMKDHLLE
jgi:hypothetical protein